MKPATLLAALGVAGLCLAGSAAAEPKPVGRLAWMVGCWRSADGANEEVWSNLIGGVMFGHATTTSGGQLAFYEQSRIDLRPPRAILAVSPNGDRPVIFTEPTDQPAAPVDKKAKAPPPEVTFVNADHDYPQRIQYRSDGRKGLAATISNLDGSRQVDYKWERCKD